MDQERWARDSASAWKRSVILLALLILIVSGCALRVKYVAEYDEIMDRAVSDLHRKTATFFARVQSSPGPDGSYEANRTFYEEARGDVAALILRARVSEKGLAKTPLTSNFEDLQKQYEDLAALHKTSPPPVAILSAESAFEQSFRAIIENLLFLKWNRAQL